MVTVVLAVLVGVLLAVMMRPDNPHETMVGRVITIGLMGLILGVIIAIILGYFIPLEQVQYTNTVLEFHQTGDGYDILLDDGRIIDVDRTSLFIEFGSSDEAVLIKTDLTPMVPFARGNPLMVNLFAIPGFNNPEPTYRLTVPSGTVFQ